MKFSNFLKRLFSKEKDKKGRGLILYPDVSLALQGEKVLKEEGYQVKVVAPPPAFREGCDLAVEIHLMERLGIERVLKEKNLSGDDIVPLDTDTISPLNLVKVTEFFNATMVTAGNMKLVFDDEGVIRNISGGGCPDVPYLHSLLLDKRLDEVQQPKDVGFTLCALMLQRAYEEALKIWKGE